MKDQSCGMTVHEPTTGMPIATFSGANPEVVFRLYKLWMRDLSMNAALEDALKEGE
jgi:hypothetical protein